MRLRISLTLALSAVSVLVVGAVVVVSAVLLARDPSAGDVYWIPLVVGGAALPPLVLLAYLAARSLARPIEALSQAVKSQEAVQVERGLVNRPDEVGRIAEGVRGLASDKERYDRQLEHRRRQIFDLLELMSAGVVVVSEDGRVVIANRAAAEILKTGRGDLAGHPLVHRARHFPVQPLMDQALGERAAVREPVALADGRILVVEAIPLLHAEDDARHVFLLFRDESVRLRTEQMRRDFVANVSHELKTPLAGLSLLTSTLEHAVVEDPDRAREFSHRIAKEIERLTDLVTDLLTLSRLEEGVSRRELEEQVDLPSVAMAVHDELRPAFAQREVILQTDIRDPAPVKGDSTLLETLVRNLLDNALRHTDPGGLVRLSVRANGTAVILTVTDNGIGIPRDEQDRIFERFYRVDKARSRQTGGTGLGLSIVRHIVEQHGGHITVDSTLGVGSTFTVRLPLAEPAGHPGSAEDRPATGPRRS